MATKLPKAKVLAKSLASCMALSTATAFAAAMYDRVVIVDSFEIGEYAMLWRDTWADLCQQRRDLAEKHRRTANAG